MSATQFGPTLRCRHCGNMAPMKRVGGYSQVQRYDSIEGGDIFDLYECPSCHRVTLTRTYWDDAMDPFDVEVEELDPSQSAVIVGLPREIERAYVAAQKVKGIDANAYAVLLGRVLELVCAERNAAGRTLAQQIKDLAAKGEIPANLLEVANGLRGFRNAGAHASVGDLTEAEVSLLEDLNVAILAYVYSAPYLAARAEEQLSTLRHK